MTESLPQPRSARSRRNIFRKVDDQLTSLASRPILAAIVIVLLALLTSALPSLLVGALPRPIIHDEFSYLLAADTFLHGRLTNPQHPLWKFFQTLHELMRPTYMSKYPPGQGLFIALGELIFRYPIAGVWLSAVLATLATYWMLRAWVDARWSIVGGIICAIAFTSSIGWTNSYMGGSVVELGAALTWGGVRWITRRRARWSDGIACGIGLAICANSRPLEGAAVTLPVMIYLIVATIRAGGRRKEILLRGWCPIAVLMTATIVWMGYYNHAITGQWTQLPYQRYTLDNDIVPVFYWQPLTLHEFSEPRLEQFNRGYALNSGLFWRIPMTQHNWLGLQRFKLECFLTFAAVLGYAPILLIVPAIFAALNDPRLWFLAAGVLCLWAISLICTYGAAHYYGGIVCIVVAITVAGMQQLERWIRECSAASARIFCRTIKAIAVVAMLLGSANSMAGACELRINADWKYACPIDGLPPLAPIEAKPCIEEWLAKKSPGGALLFVQYAPEPFSQLEWVYNAADLDASQVIWAHDRGIENRELMNYYPKRSAWLMQVDATELYYQLRPLKR